jgi:RNA polymerase-binding transcription factor DksA
MGTKLPAEVIEAYRRRLLELLDAVEDKTGSIEEHLLEPSGDPDGQTEDEGLEEQAFERDYEVIAVEDRIASEARLALERIEDGTYGVCESCARPIERERLDALPYTDLCAACARRREAEQAR